MTSHLPQPYPLWCAELSPDGEISVGLVVGWLQVATDTGSYDLNPVIARSESGGPITSITGAIDDEKLFLATSRETAEGLARRHAAATVEPGPLDYAMWTVYLEGNWRWVTEKMTTEAREAAVAAVLRYDAHLKRDEPAENLTDRSSLAWWEN